MELSSRLTTRWLGRPHEHHASIHSTNDRALALAGEGAAHGTLVTADRQTAGRGRRGRSWSSDASGDIYASFVLHLPAAPGVSAAGLVMGVAIREVLATLVRDSVTLKWPNDVRVAGRKIAGVLCESRWDSDGVAIVVGFGVNVKRGSFPPQLHDLATSLARLSEDPQRVPEPADVLVQILTRAEPLFDAFVDQGFPAVRERYEAACETLHRRVYLHEDGAEPQAAVAAGLTDDGALLVRKEGVSGLLQVDAGEVSLSLDPTSV